MLVKSKRAAQRVLKSVIRYLKDRLKLEINYEYSRIVKSSDCDYLGFIINSLLGLQQYSDISIMY
ncbi:MAG: hypothetical protein IID16_02985 [Candidatus Marinimicrobia bacterium]|nr:hypothetical protein [Candidatus Neomarinimicrobiota bacterium]